MSTDRSVIEPPSGLSREIGMMIACLEEVRAQTIGVIADMTKDELCRRLMPTFHQPGGLVLHLAECEFWWIPVVYGHHQITDEDRKLAHLDDSTESDFALKDIGAEECIETLNTVHQRALEHLRPLADSDLDRVVSFAAHPTRNQGSLRWILHHLIDHESHHRGQISMIKRVMREG